jgi:release factor glutamine methyltransferase
LVAGARARLRDAGIKDAEADLDARLLAQRLLDWDAAQFFTGAGDSPPTWFSSQYDGLVARRVAREPMAYITGRQEFWDLTFEVSPAVLIPRPETELIIEASLDLFPDTETPLAIADVCTGCGCLAVALARQRPEATILATDISADALGVARRNGVRHNVEQRVRFMQTDLLRDVDQPFDLIVANPPYVRRRDRVSMQPEVRDHEPALALFAGDDGLAVIRGLVAQSAAHLKPGGIVMFEFGFGQDVEVEQLISDAAELTLLGLRRDLQGIARTAIARRS